MVRIAHKLFLRFLDRLSCQKSTCALAHRYAIGAEGRDGEDKLPPIHLWCLIVRAWSLTDSRTNQRINCTSIALGATPMRKQVALAASFLLALQIFASDRVQASQNQPVYNYGTWNNAQKLNVQWRPGGGYVQPAPYSPNRDIICYPASRTCTNNGRYSQSWTQSEFGWRGGQHYGGGNRQRDAYSPHRDIICYPDKRICTNNGRYSQSWTQSEFSWRGPR